VVKLTETKENWVTENEEIFTVNWKGEEIKLDGVPLKKNNETGEVLVNIDDVIKAEQEHHTKNIGIKSFEIYPLLLLYAKLRFYPHGIIEKGYRLRKMIFYLQKRLEKNIYEKSFIFDEIVPARAGPTPKNIKETIENLAKMGLIDYTWENDPKISAKFTLTGKGEEIAKDLWRKTPDDIKMEILNVKEEIHLISSDALKHKVHAEYPEYKKTYTDLDTD
jgi:DNA-binding PadR family transcriptional regulator